MKSTFKVLIVGGGPVGLTAAHALRLAGIDFTLLEQRKNIVFDVGASLALSAESLRVMHQLGLLNRLLSKGTEVRRKQTFTIDGHKIRDTTYFKHMQSNYGIAPVVFHRAELIQILLDGLPVEDKSKIITGKVVTSIESDDHKVTVKCADGSLYEGSLVLGADGVHSKTRRLMRDLALKNDPNRPWDPDFPFLSTYRCMWCSFPRPETSKAGDNFDTQHQDSSVMYICGREKGWLGVFEKLPKPTHNQNHYAAQDVLDFAERFAEYPITETLRVGDVFSLRTSAGIADLEEGVANHWSFGRIVLAGDSCHKLTPNAGLGFQNGIQDVVYLCNALHSALATTPTGILEAHELDELFREYHDYRSNALKFDALVSATLTRVHSWASMPFYLFARYIFAQDWWEYIFINYVSPPFIRKALVLTYVTLNEPFTGHVSWKHRMDGL